VYSVRALSTQINPIESSFKLEQLQSELASRQSVVHFAHTGVSLLAAALLSGAAGKQCWDLPEDKMFLALPAILATLGLAVYALVHYVRGKKVRAVEEVQFDAMMNLRRTLKLDDPASLLPR
jgi:hypothetical protein